MILILEVHSSLLALCQTKLSKCLNPKTLLIISNIAVLTLYNSEDKTGVCIWSLFLIENYQILSAVPTVFYLFIFVMYGVL